MSSKKKKGSSGTKKGGSKAKAATQALQTEAPDQDANHDSVEIKIPEGFKGGDLLKIEGPSGKAIQIELPTNAQPGQVITLQKSTEKEGDAEEGGEAEEMFLPGVPVKDIAKDLPMTIDASAEECFAYGMQQMRLKKWGDGEIFMRACLSKDPNNSKAWFQLGSNCFMMNDLVGACAALAKAQDKSKPDQTGPSRFEILLNLGSAAQMKENSLELAIWAFQKAHDLDPKHKQCAANLEMCKKEAELLKEGIVTFRIPKGAKSGQVLKVKAPDGTLIPIKVPPGAKAGQAITIRARPKEEPKRVFVPEGFSGGDVVAVPAPSGKEVQWKLPADAKEGDEIELKTGGKECGDFLINGRVKVNGLKKLKGQHGTLLSFDKDKKKWTVALDNGEEELIKPFHMEELIGSPQIEVDPDSGEVFITVPDGATGGDVIRIGTGLEGDASQDVTVPEGAKPGDRVRVQTSLTKEELVMDKMRNEAKKRLESGTSKSALPWLDKILAEGASQAAQLAENVSSVTAPTPPTPEQMVAAAAASVAK